MAKTTKEQLTYSTSTWLAKRLKKVYGKKLPRGSKVYDVWRQTGKIWKRTGEMRRDHLCRIAGRRGEWFKTSGDKITGPFKTRHEAALARSTGSGPPKKATRKYFGVRRGYGDDLYSWTVYNKQTRRPVLTGESRKSAGYEADRLEKEKRDAECGCRKASSHRDCAYCGCGGSGLLICGKCAKAGIDHDESLPNKGIIRGTVAKTCEKHS